MSEVLTDLKSLGFSQKISQISLCPIAYNAKIMASSTFPKKKKICFVLIN